jgi:hypothetical protein
MKSETDSYSADETKQRFDAILRGAMHKPTQHKDVPKKKRKAVKPSSSSGGRASG